MTLKNIICTTFLSFFIVGTGTTQILPDERKHIEVDIPTEFENMMDYRLHSWADKNTKKTDCAPSDAVVIETDDVYKDRLSKMPHIMELPYNSAIRSYIELYTVKKRGQLSKVLGMSGYYFPVFEEVLEANSLPLELKYLPVIESALNATIVSRMGAAGLWQFMITTGRNYGLEINSLVDERLDPLKSTHAAVKFLKDLYDIYGDWHLVIAAYNCGPGNVNKAIRRAGGKSDYWNIYPYLPKETRGYVPIFIGANYAMHYAEEHNVCPLNVEMPVLTDTIMVDKRIHLEQIASVLNLSIDEVRLLNPQYRKDIIPANNEKKYSLCLPLNYALAYIDKEKEILAYKADELTSRQINAVVAQAKVTNSGGSNKLVYHKVTKGQTLSTIAVRYGVSVKNLCKWNGISGSRIYAGQRLKVYR
jgi:membrane-bound lytic murein transglycosylase D